MPEAEKRFLYNTTITKVQLMKSGSNQYGEWTLYNFWIDDLDWKAEKFGCFQSDKDPTPVVGMKLAKIEFETVVREKDGKNYTNYDAKKIEPVQVAEKPVPSSKPIPAGHTPQDSQTQPPPPATVSDKTAPKPVPAPVSDEKYFSFYVSYVKDLAISLIEAKTKEFENSTLHEACSKIITEAITMEATVGQKNRLAESFTRKMLADAISSLCNQHDLPYKETKAWLSETQTFKDRIQRIFGNLSFTATKIEVLEKIMDTSRIWIPIAKKYFKNLEEKKQESSSGNPFKQDPSPKPEESGQDQESGPNPDQSAFPDDIPFGQE